LSENRPISRNGPIPGRAKPRSQSRLGRKVGRGRKTKGPSGRTAPVKFREEREPGSAGRRRRIVCR
jgi:hypothetical protein